MFLYGLMCSYLALRVNDFKEEVVRTIAEDVYVIPHLISWLTNKTSGPCLASQESYLGGVWS